MMLCGLPNLGTRVRGRDAGGKPFEGIVTAHISRHMVELDDYIATPMSLITREDRDDGGTAGRVRNGCDHSGDRRVLRADTVREFAAMTHLMLDIETLGTRPGAVVLSVACVRFSDEARFQINMRVDEQQALGLTIDPATQAWWGQQDPAAWQAATSNSLPLVQGLEYVRTWMQWAGTDPLIWCHGATFDCPLLGAVYERAGLAPPWAYWAVRDTRTLYDLAGINVKDYAVPPPHVALNDAIAQTRAANAALAVLARAHQQPGQVAA